MSLQRPTRSKLLVVHVGYEMITMADTFVFPDKSQWSLRTWLRYLSMKLRQQRVYVCEDSRDDTLQSIIDNESGVIRFAAGDYFQRPPHINGDTHLVGNPCMESPISEDPIKSIRRPVGDNNFDEDEQEWRVAHGMYADPHDE